MARTSVPAGVAGGVGVLLVKRNQFRLATAPLLALVSNDTFTTCWPAVRLIPVLVMVVQVCQPPVLGTVRLPVTSTPPISTCSFPPAPGLDTRRVRSSTPAAVTLTVYLSHSPGWIQPTLNPPPVSVVA